MGAFELHLPATGCNAMQCRTVQCNAMHFASEKPLDVNSDDSHFSVDARKMNTNQTHQSAGFSNIFARTKNATKYAEWTKTKAPELCVYVLKRKKKQTRRDREEKNAAQTHAYQPSTVQWNANCNHYINSIIWMKYVHNYLLRMCMCVYGCVNCKG